MHMADDTSRSNRSNDPYRRAATDTEVHGDPLAELARLIGQTDPFAEYAASRQRRAALAAPAPAALAASDWRSRATPIAAGVRTQAPSQPFQRQDSRLTTPPVDYAAQPDFEERDAPPYAEPVHAEPAPSDTGNHASGHRDDHAFLAQGEPMGPDDDEIYDDAPPARSRAGRITAVTIIAFAMLGSAGAYAYRSYSTGAKSTQPPPVIVAEKTPTKVIPTNDGPSGKNTDRVRDPGLNERMVSREEQPVELRNMIAAAPPRVVLQGTQSQSGGASGLPNFGTTAPQYAPTPQPAPQGSGAATPPPQTGSAAPTTEPKKVRTVTIRPDTGDPSGRPVGSIGDVARAAAPPSTRGTGPISLDPRAEPPAQRPQPPAAAAPPTRIATAPTNVTPAPAHSGSGYVVQISSQKSEAEAQASIKVLQAKYPHLLNGNPPRVTRADLGAKGGVVYRAVVGPFASVTEANSFCSGLKAAGGQCFVPRN